MSDQIDKFCSDLRTNMTMIESKFQALKTKAAGKADEAERTVRQEIESIQKKIDESKAAVEAAKTKVKEWADEQKTATQSKIAEWKAKGETKNLEVRADLADHYAKATSAIASSAVNHAAKAALEAVLAHFDLAASKFKKAS